ncbi:MAG: exodeoxyribonuclease V subunit alpha [Deltaproteobacteria bacterium]|nr:exodeoxyribonuclease V subunit alpha [Deltaproteobacteria bacterium]
MSQYTEFDLDNLFEQNFFSNLDYFFARSMAGSFDENESIILASLALVSKSLFEGHICLDIKEIAKTLRPVFKINGCKVKFPEFNTWIKALNDSSMVSSTLKTPLVLDSNHRLYFAKYYNFQARLARNIAKRVSLKPLNMNETLIDEMVESCFTRGIQTHQKSAVKNAILNHFTIISGGPGTGKTYATAIIKEILSSYAKTQGFAEPKIICVAPTGKAASKMEEGGTIHSILKPLRDAPGFYYNKKNLLQTDVIIVDEASMIDILLLTRLLEAVPMTAKVIILGDKHQLSSVQAGSVFSDICSVKGLSHNLFTLEYNFRSKGKTGIENMSKAINANDEKRLEDILTSGLYTDLVFENFNGSRPVASIAGDYIREGYKPFAEADTLEASLNKLDDFKILCAHNSGEYGTLQINNICEKILRSKNNFDIQEGFFKKIIMVSANDYKKGLFNGDTGIVYENKGEINAFFRGRDDNIRQFRYSDLPGSNAAFAITIHKSQGSEFNKVLIIIPDRLSPVMTRQLLYTGVTRAKGKIIIVGNINIIKKAISLSVKRDSGLSRCLEEEILKT